MRTNRRTKFKLTGIVCLVMLGLLAAGCAVFEKGAAEFSQAFRGVSATMTTYDQSGALIDQVHGTSFRITRDNRFDGTNADGTSKEDSSVLLISLGASHISHVGSSLILAEDGVIDVTEQFGTAKVAFENTTSGVPFMNDLFERFRNNWRGKSKTLLIRSQDGLPIGVYAGDSVEVFATDVPKSTWFQVDGMMLFVSGVTTPCTTTTCCCSWWGNRFITIFVMMRFPLRYPEFYKLKM